MAESLEELESGYDSTPEAWLRFLECWADEANDKLADADVAEGLRAVYRRERWSERGQIAADHFPDGVFAVTQLPKSIRHFYLALSDLPSSRFSSYIRNVFAPMDDFFLYSLVESEDFLLWTSEEMTPVSDEEYYRYQYSRDFSNLQDPVYFRGEYLRSLVLIADFGNTGFILLNPIEKTKDGEWEAWNLSWSAPGAYRYRSFAELMQNLMVEMFGDEGEGGILPPALLRQSCSALLSTVATNSAK